MFKVDILTIFPEQIAQFTQYGIFRIAQESGALHCTAHDLRNWTTDKHRTVDDRPYGGGPGMVMKIEPVYKALQELRSDISEVVALTPNGKLLDQATLRNYATDTERHIILLAGHYEGFDQRILDHLVDTRISVGKYVLSGGELPALTLLDGITRLLPGVLGNEQSAQEESYENGEIEYAHYTRPDDFNGWKVPEVLLSGDHQQISKWRSKSSKKNTELFNKQ